MSDLSNDIDNLKKKYREIFSQTIEYFNQRIENIKPQEFLKFLNEDILNEVFKQKLEILESRKKFSCGGCAACCKLACSEFSYDDLKQKSQNNDNFATQFISVFIPYENELEAEKIYPEYFELLKNRAENEKVYFYYCPKVTKDNRCSDYENRPPICRDFPDNPLGFLPKTCGYLKWKEEVEEKTLKLRSLIEIIEFYKSKITE